MDADRRAGRLASRRHGLVTGRQLTAVGLSRGAIRHRIASGRLHRVHASVFAVGHTALTVHGRLLAAVMACGPEGLLSHTHAAHLWDAMPPWIEIDLSAINVTVPAESRRGRRPGIAVHRAQLGDGERADHHGIPVTSPGRTLLDLGSVTSLWLLERALNQVVADGIATPAEVRRTADRYPRRPGTRALRTVLDAAERYDGVTRSALEERFLDVVRRSGLPAPVVNARIGLLTVDAVWRSERVAVELDGYRWHRTRGRVESDRARETKLRGAGFTVLRYSARQVFDEPLVVLTDLVSVLTERRA
jgi:very-short-patch-repair endonuclease